MPQPTAMAHLAVGDPAADGGEDDPRRNCRTQRLDEDHERGGRAHHAEEHEQDAPRHGVGEHEERRKWMGADGLGDPCEPSPPADVAPGPRSSSTPFAAAADAAARSVELDDAPRPREPILVRAAEDVRAGRQVWAGLPVTSQPDRGSVRRPRRLGPQRRRRCSTRTAVIRARARSGTSTARRVYTGRRAQEARGPNMQHQRSPGLFR